MKRLLLVLAACAHPAPIAPAAPGGPPAKTAQLNEPGATVDVEAALPAGYVSVVDFWATWCEACKTQGAALESGVASDARIVIRKVDVGEGGSAIATAYNISNLPHMRIYDRQKRLRFDLVGPDCARATEYAKQLAAE